MKPPRRTYTCAHCPARMGMDIRPVVPPTHSCPPRGGRAFPLVETVEEET